MSKVYFPKDHTPAEWRNMMHQGRKEAFDSFERCDTDGFLSQWANNVMASVYELCAQLAEDGGLCEFKKLADAEGNLIEGAREVETRYGWSWVIDTPEGTKWFSPSKARDKAKADAANLAKGYTFIKVKKAAGVVLVGNNVTCHPIAIELKNPR